MKNHKNFQVGDRVIIGCEEDIRNCSNGFTEDMLRYARREATIVYVGCRAGYRLDIDGGHWFWCDRSLHPAHPSSSSGLNPVDDSDLLSLIGGSL